MWRDVLGTPHKKSITVVLLACLLLTGSLIVRKARLKSGLEAQTKTLVIQATMLNSLNKVDLRRRQNIEKVLAVIERYNPGLSDTLKKQIASEIWDASLRYENLDVDLICAIITHESALSWNPTVVSPVGALGLMQVMPATGEFLARIEGVEWTSAQEVLFDPILNIRLGSRYLSSMIELYDIDGGLAAYNGGGRQVEMWLARNRDNAVLYKETRDYVPAVLSLYEEFKN